VRAAKMRRKLDDPLLLRLPSMRQGKSFDEALAQDKKRLAYHQTKVQWYGAEIARKETFKETEKEREYWRKHKAESRARAKAVEQMNEDWKRGAPQSYPMNTDIMAQIAGKVTPVEPVTDEQGADYDPLDNDPDYLAYVAQQKEGTAK